MKGWMLSVIGSAAVLGLMLAGGCAHEHEGMKGEHAKQMQAMEASTDGIAVVIPTDGNHVHGTVRFTKTGPMQVTVTVHLAGLAPNSEHAFHIHEWGDLTDMQKGMSTGGHYDPEGTHFHAALDASVHHHAGDMGNLTADAEGNVDHTLVLDDVTICGHHNPIVGRAVILHAMPDDFSQPTGNAGGRIAMGVIGLTKAAK